MTTTTPTTSTSSGKSHAARQREAASSTPSGAGLDLCDFRLRQIRIASWTSVDISDETAARVISLFLEIDHPVLGLFDADLFLDSFVSGDQHFCSPLLVNSLLCWACKAYSHFDPECLTLSMQFLAEALTLWDHEMHVATLTTVAAAQVLSLTASADGQDAQSLAFLKYGIAMGRQMGLFGMFQGPSARRWLDNNTDWLKAASHTAWGVFSWVTFRCLHVQQGHLEAAPELPIPGDDRVVAAVARGKFPKSHPLPPYMGKTFTRMCDFWTIVHEVIWTYYDSDDHVAPASRAHLEFAEDVYQKLLRWADDLPTDLARGNQNTHHIMIAHIYYHASILDLFRPFMQSANRTTNLKGFSTLATPETICSASLNQLRRLVAMFRASFACASYTFLWHTALLYVANAMLRYATVSHDAEWTSSFRVCLDGYVELSRCFRIAGIITKGLLAMAIRNGVMSGAEAHDIMDRLGNPTNEEQGHVDLVEDQTSIMVDLDLAMTDPFAAQVINLADKLDELVMFDEFTTTNRGKSQRN